MRKREGSVRNKSYSSKKEKHAGSVYDQAETEKPPGSLRLIQRRVGEIKDNSTTAEIKTGRKQEMNVYS